MKRAIIDIAAYYWAAWHVSQGQEVSSAARSVLRDVRAVANQYEEIYIALDAPPYKRTEVYPEYKANRPERNESAIHELKSAIEQLAEDGYIMAKCQGYEADDVIATLVARYPDATVYGTDKDLLQCCDLTNIKTGEVKSAQSRFNVRRDQIVDYLTLIGDIADNIPGVKGVGDKTAAAMLAKFGTITDLYAELAINPDGFKPSTRAALADASAFIPKAQQLIELKTDCELTLEKRERKEVDHMSEETEIVTQNRTAIVPPAHVVECETEPQRQIVQVKHEALSFRQSLEPVGMNEAWKVAKAFHESRLYTQFAVPEAIFVTIMRGRALGLDATTALDSIHVIKGKPTMSAALIVGLIHNSGKAEYFDCIEQSATACTWVTKRRGSPHESRRTFTIDEAKQMQLTGKDNWTKQPAVMLQWRAASALARMVYPDVIAGLYAIEEME